MGLLFTYEEICLQNQEETVAVLGIGDDSQPKLNANAVT